MSLLERCPHFKGWYVQASMELGPEDVSLLERCPHFRGWYVQASMELGPEDVSLLERCPHSNGDILPSLSAIAQCSSMTPFTTGDRKYAPVTTIVLLTSHLLPYIQVTSVYLVGCHVRRLACFDQLPNLLWVCLDNNCISNIEVRRGSCQCITYCVPFPNIPFLPFPSFPPSLPPSFPPSPPPFPLSP